MQRGALLLQGDFNQSARARGLKVPCFVREVLWGERGAWGAAQRRRSRAAGVRKGFEKVWVESVELGWSVVSDRPRFGNTFMERIHRKQLQGLTLTIYFKKN